MNSIVHKNETEMKEMPNMRESGQNGENKKRQRGDKPNPSIDILDQRQLEDTSSRNDPDCIWMTLLELNGNLLKPKRQETIVDKYLREKNLSLLKDAMMYQNHSQHQGYLSTKDVVQLTLAYSTVHYLGLSQLGIRGAIHSARSQDLRMGLVNIHMFIQALVEIHSAT